MRTRALPNTDTSAINTRKITTAIVPAFELFSVSVLSKGSLEDRRSGSFSQEGRFLVPFACFMMSVSENQGLNAALFSTCFF